MQLPQGTVLAAWVEKSGITVKPALKPAARPVPAPVAPRPAVNSNFFEPPAAAPPARAPAERASASRAPRHEIAGFGGKVFDTYRYGIDQYRFGLAYALRLRPRIALDLPVSYAMGGAFDVIQAGIGARFTLWESATVSVYARVGGVGERFYDDDQSFYAGTVDASLGVQWRFYRGFFVGFQPGAQTMVYNPVDIPINVRSEALLTLGTAW